jgi:hypothetical protein
MSSLSLTEALEVLAESLTVAKETKPKPQTFEPWKTELHSPEWMKVWRLLDKEVPASGVCEHCNMPVHIEGEYWDVNRCSYCDGLFHHYVNAPSLKNQGKGFHSRTDCATTHQSSCPMRE